MKTYMFFTLQSCTVPCSSIPHRIRSPQSPLLVGNIFSHESRRRRMMGGDRGGGGPPLLLTTPGTFSAHLPTGAVTSWPEKKRTGRIDQRLRVEQSHSEYQTQRGRTGELALLLSPASVKDSSGLFCLRSVRAPRCLITVSPACPWTNAFSWSFFSFFFFPLDTLTVFPASSWIK